MILCIKVLLLVLLFFFLSSFTGFLFAKIGKFEEKSGCLLFFSGAVINIILFTAVSILFALMEMLLTGAKPETAALPIFKLPAAGVVWMLLLIGTAFFVCIRYWKPFSDYIKEMLSAMRTAGKKDGTWVVRILFILVLLLIALQMFGTAFFGYHQPNATRQLWTAAKAYETGSLTVSSPLMMLWAWIAWIFREHPLTIIFSASQFVMIPMYYMGYALLADKLCGNNSLRRILFLLFVCILHLFGYQSGYALGMTMLFSYFSGEVFLLHGVLPLLLFLLLTAMGKRQAYEAAAKSVQAGYAGAGNAGMGNTADKTFDSEADWEEEDMKKHKIVNARNIGIALVVFAVLAAGAIYILNNKINSLHHATQNLQLAMDEKCSIYEFKPEAGEVVEGYLLRQSDGGLVMLGGGAAANGEELYEFLMKYGAKLDKWYLYGETEADMGAYAYCTEDKELEVGSVYYLTGMEEVK